MTILLVIVETALGIISVLAGALSLCFLVLGAIAILKAIVFISAYVCRKIWWRLK